MKIKLTVPRFWIHLRLRMYALNKFFSLGCQDISAERTRSAVRSGPEVEGQAYGKDSVSDDPAIPNL